LATTDLFAATCPLLSAQGARFEKMPVIPRLAQHAEGPLKR